ncbi:hypothetical protein E4S40_05230 [Algoriphagus kandeliae]|uniref:ECF transporter S component n=1 Tax=Algoriphagus kandeliae TaxID=2562278 RepID=A0A4Y9QSZ2_9BACT|nr:hypothetical protein [Algoriphagus kandeliae]TFV95624.1 hypothetical protein E4S40_05230 [Algoriphagus kandeliae]
MKSLFNDRYSLLIIFLGIIAAGFVHWPIPYKEVIISSQPYILKMGIAGIVVGVIGGILKKKAPLNTAVLVSLGFALAIFFRVVYDSFALGPTYHNLWPFEILFIEIIAFPSSLLGAGVMSLINKFIIKN